MSLSPATTLKPSPGRYCYCRPRPRHCHGGVLVATITNGKSFAGWGLTMLLLISTMAAVVVLGCDFRLNTGDMLDAAAAAADTTTTQRHPDFMSHLPGLNQPLPTPWYSGYLSYQLHGQVIHTHYVLVVAEDDYDGTKPLIYWSNGGPGASSLFGLLTELGPYLFSDASLLTDDYRATGIPTPIYNPHSWSRLGSILMIDQPAPVGFSYCGDDIKSTSCNGIHWTDELAAENAYAALQAFYAQFSCLRSSDLYLTGESYAGIYIPMLAQQILQDDKNPLPLKGFAVGDGCLGTETGICSELGGSGVDLWHPLFLFGHGQIPVQTFHEFMRACVSPNNDDWSDLSARSGDDTNFACQKAQAKVKEQAGGYYEYHLYDDCTYRNGILAGAINDYSCGGYVVMAQYLALPEVQEAFHVYDNYFSVDNAENFDYTPTEKDLRGFYQDLTKQNQARHHAKKDEDVVRVLIYNGDADPSITSMAAQNWTWHLGLPETESWRPWTVDGCRRMGGYVTRYDGALDFLTIRGAGHMVPTYKADATFAFISAWINNEEYPKYVKDCTGPKMVEGGKSESSLLRAD